MSVPESPAPPTCRWWRGPLRVLRTLALAYLGVLLLLLLLENSLVYHPSSAAKDWYPPPSPEVQDVWLTSADGTKLHGWWLPHPEATGAVLHFHGNAGNLSHRGAFVAELHHSLKESILIIDYPGYGRSEGSPSEAGCYAAADAAYAWLTKEKKIPPERVIICGKSLGGGVAVDLASREKHRALVLIKSFTTMPDVAASLYPWLPVRWLMRNRYDSLGKLAKCTQPTFIAHGTTDELIPFAHGERLYEAAPGRKHFEPMSNVGHNSPLPQSFFTALGKFLKETDGAAE